MAKTMMCPNPDCAQVNVKRTVLGGCESCGNTLVLWVDPDVPTIEQIAYIVCDVALFDKGKILPRHEIEKILTSNKVLRDEWLKRLSEIDWKRRLNEIHIQDALAQ